MRYIRRTLVAMASLSGALVAGSSFNTLSAQSAGSGTALRISPYAGYMVFGDYLKGPLNTSLSNAPGLLYGTQVNLALAPNLSLIGNVGYTSSDIKVGIPILGGLSVGHSSMLIYDAGLEYDLGSSTTSALPISPFIQAGVGAIRYNMDESILQTNATNLAGNIGIGADVALVKGVALRLLGKDYIGKFNFQDATGLGITGETAHNFAFSAGLRFDF